MGELAVVTGASSGIGAAYAEQLATAGWDVVVVARRRDRLEQLADRLGASHGVDVQVRDTDLADRSAVAELAAQLEAMAPAMLVNDAGLAHYMPFVELPPARLEELLQVNVVAPVALSRAVVPGMVQRGSGSIINVASLLAFSGAVDAPFLPQRALYAAGKSFLVVFSQLLAAELRASGVRVQVVCPGVVRSEFHSRQGLDMSQVPRMEPDAVARASLQDLERGELVCIPGLEDLAARDQVLAAPGRLMGVSRSAEVAERYRTAG